MTGIEEHESSSATTTARDPWLGSVLGDRYRIDEWIGQGGMGVVYRGEHQELGKRVAIKRLDPRIASDPISFERFRREAIAASRIESPHVVHVFDWGKAPDGSPYLVMELLEGGDLRKLFQREGRLSPQTAASIIGQVLRALIRTHQSQIIHRDLKPENVFLCQYDSDEPYVKLLDFGISKRTTEDTRQETVTRRGTILGTASYMSPEQARGEAKLDARSDLYSVGAILFEALTGRVPHRARTYEGTLVDICTRDADDIRLHAPLVPQAVAHVVSRALRRDVSQRFQSAKEFLDALTAAVPDVGRRLSENPTGPTATRPESLDASRPTKFLLRRGIVVGVAALLIGAGLGAWSLMPSAGTARPVVPIPAASDRTVLDESVTPLEKANLPTATPQVSAESTTAVGAPSHKPTNGAAPGSNAARTTPRPSTSHDQSTSGPKDQTGVAPALKLRRTMP